MSSANSPERAFRGIERCIMDHVTMDPKDYSGNAIDSSELISYLSKRVTRAEIWECPLEKLGDILQLLGIVHQGIVVTMESSDMLLVHKMPRGMNMRELPQEKKMHELPQEKKMYELPREIEENQGAVIVTYKSNMGENWSHVGSKDVQSAKLSDYLDKCGLGFNLITDNCIHAVTRMWSLN